MRTNIVIDDDLMKAAMKAGEFKTKRDAVEEGLRLVARRATYQKLRAARGKLNWGLGGDWTVNEDAKAQVVQEPAPAYRAKAPKKAKR
jgi:Arc/MetJ family transcription regulator